MSRHQWKRCARGDISSRPTGKCRCQITVKHMRAMKGPRDVAIIDIFVSEIQVGALKLQVQNIQAAGR